MLLKIGQRVHNLAMCHSIDLCDPATDQVVLHYGGQNSIPIRGDGARKIRNLLTNGEIKVIDAAEPIEVEPEPTLPSPSTPTPTTSTTEPAKEPATVSAPA